MIKLRHPYLSSRYVVNNLKIFIRNSLYQGFAAIVDRLVFLLIFILIARTFGEGEIGKLSTVLSFINILNIISTFGLNVILHKESSVKRDINNELKVILQFKLIFTILLFFLLIPFAQFSDALELDYIAIISLGIIFFDISTLILMIYLGRNQSKKYFLIQFFSRISLIALISLLCLTDLKHFISFAFLASGLFQLIITLIDYRPELKNIAILSKINITLLNTIVKKSFPIFAGLFFVLFYDKVDLILITTIVNPNETGLYYAAYSLMKSSTLFGAFYLNYFFTQLSRTFAENRFEEYRYNFNLSIIISIVIGIISFILLFTLSEKIINLLYGSKFISSIEILRIISISPILIFLNYNLGVISNSISRHYIPMIAAFISLIFNLIFNIIYLPKYGIIASAIVTVYTEILMCLLLIFQLYWFFKKSEITI